MWALAFLLGSRTALAYSMAGFGVPCVGGGLANNSEIGPLGLPYNPAAAWTEGPDFVTDLGSIHTVLTEKLDYWDEQTQKGGFSLPVPYLGYATPVGPFGMGINVMAPYARLGSGDPEGPQRYHTISGTFVLVETDLSLAWAPNASWTFGGSLRLGEFIQSSTRSLDTGALLDGMLGPEAKVPEMDPFLEGSQTLSNMRDFMFGGAGGLRYTSASGYGFQVSARPGWTAHVTDGLVVVAPSRDLTALIEGDVELWIRFPSQFYASATLPLGDRLTLVPDAGLIRWSEVNSVSIVHDFRLASTDPVFQKLLESYGLSEAEFLDNSKPSASDFGMDDVFDLGLNAKVDVGETWLVQGGVHYEPNAVPSPYASPGNLDFAMTRVSLAGMKATRSWFRTGATIDYGIVSNRKVTDSVLSLSNKQGSGRVYPSGNGTYDLDLFRIGVLFEVAR